MILQIKLYLALNLVLGDSIVGFDRYFSTISRLSKHLDVLAELMTVGILCYQLKNPKS